MTIVVDLPLASTVICGTFTVVPNDIVTLPVGPYEPAVTPLSAKVVERARFAEPLKLPDAVASPVRDIVLDVVR